MLIVCQKQCGVKFKKTKAIEFPQNHGVPIVGGIQICVAMIHFLSHDCMLKSFEKVRVILHTGYSLHVFVSPFNS